MNKNLVVGNPGCSVRTVYKLIVSSDLMHVLHSRWVDLALELDVPNFEIRKLQRDQYLDETSFADAIRYLLEVWVGQQGSNATLQKLTSALEHSGLRAIAEKLEMEFGVSSADHNPADLPTSSFAFSKN